VTISLRKTAPEEKRSKVDQWLCYVRKYLGMMIEKAPAKIFERGGAFLSQQKRKHRVCDEKGKKKMPSPDSVLQYSYTK
jgi:hypothetical protein